MSKKTGVAPKISNSNTNPAIGNTDSFDEYVAKFDLVAFNSGSIEHFDELLRMYIYQGYKPKEFIKHLFRLYKKACESTGVTPTAAGFNEDMYHFVVFYAIRGTDMLKAANKSTPEGATRMYELVEKYEILPKDVKIKTLTDVKIGRIAGCFPAMVANAIKSAGEYAREVGTFQTGLPRCLHFPGAPALIPKNNVTAFNAWVRWGISFAEKVQAPDTSEETVRKYGTVIWDSTLIEDKARITMWSQWADNK